MKASKAAEKPLPTVGDVWDSIVDAVSDDKEFMQQTIEESKKIDDLQKNVKGHSFDGLKVKKAKGKQHKTKTHRKNHEFM